MPNPHKMIELWRGGLLESYHFGHGVIWGAKGLVKTWGDPGAIIFPRSSYKMIQALPLIESGAASDLGLKDHHLALACASHQGAALHINLAEKWLADMGKSETDLRCGSQEPDDQEERHRLIQSGKEPCQLHNNCSGKHCGFLAVVQKIKADPEYLALDHPLQFAIKQTIEELCDENIAGHGIDGCSAPNFAVSLTGLARAMQAFSNTTESGNIRPKAMYRLRQAMALYPELVAGKGRACTELMQAMQGENVVKVGAEAVYVAILPKHKMGIALKITDGSVRAAEAALTAILGMVGVLDLTHPMAQKRLPSTQKSRRGFVTGELRLSADFP